MCKKNGCGMKEEIRRLSEWVYMKGIKKANSLEMRNLIWFGLLFIFSLNFPSIYILHFLPRARDFWCENGYWAAWDFYMNFRGNRIQSVGETDMIWSYYRSKRRFCQSVSLFLIVNMIKGRVGWVISCPISEFQPPKWLQQPFSKWKNDTMSNRLRRVNKENGSQLHWLKNETVHVIRTRIYIW